MDIYYWWLKELPCWFQDRFYQKFCEFQPVQNKKDNFTQGEIQPMQGQVEH